MVTEFQAGWPEATIDATQLANLCRPYATTLVAEVIADRLEAELGMPSLGELSRVLRAYAPKATKSDTPPPPARPQNPWVADMPALPDPPADIDAHLAEMRDALSVGAGLFDSRPRTKPEPPVIEMTIVPPHVREAIELGRKSRKSPQPQGEPCP